MEKLIERIEEYIRECGSFNIEEVDTTKKVFHEGTELTYFDLSGGLKKTDEENKLFWYNELNEDTLLDILYVVMEWKHKWDIKLKNEGYE
jgi:hypothetical protein